MNFHGVVYFDKVEREENLFGKVKWKDKLILVHEYEGLVGLTKYILEWDLKDLILSIVSLLFKEREEEKKSKEILKKERKKEPRN